MSISRIANNISAINATRNVDKTGLAIQKSVERLSSGLRINRAGDDAAGLTIANRLRTQVQGLNQAIDNASSGINLINVAEGALEETTVRLNRIRTLAIQAANSGVNDFAARSALQDEVFQSIDEITRIGNTTQFSSNFLLNGDFAVNTKFIGGQEEVGINIDASPVASTLKDGKSFLNIIKTKDETAQIISGDTVGTQQILNTGIRNQSDIAVSTGFFSTAFVNYGQTAGTASVGGTALIGSFFNGVSISGTGGGANPASVIQFAGVLSDGITKYAGSLSLQAATDVTGLISAINASIDNAEVALFGVNAAASVAISFRTTVALGTGTNVGRLTLLSSGQFINQANLDLSIFRNGGLAIQTKDVTRSGAIGTDSAINGQGAVGNNLTAITGSTFGVGQFDIDVTNVQSAQQRRVQNTVVFRDSLGGIINNTVSLDLTTTTRTVVLNGTFEGGVYTGGTTLTDGSTITLNGINADGTTFSSSFTFDSTGVQEDTILDDFTFNSISGLVTELNFRTRVYAAASNATNGDQTRFEDALFTFNPEGKLELVDDLSRSNSQTNFTLTFETAGGAAGGTTTIQDKAELKQEGFYEEATFSVNDGEFVRARAGEVITLEGEKSTIVGVPQPSVTFRLGNGFTQGLDKLETTAAQFTGSLNGGEVATFQNGDDDVVFVDGTSGGNNGVARILTIDFDSVVDVTRRTDGLPDTGRTLIVSTVNRSLNFQIGANDNQNFQAAIGDLRSDALGFGEGSGRTVNNINVTTLDGANEAIRIVDEALAQVDKTRSILGAATNRLEATISNLSVGAENLTASESRIRDADIARESSEFTGNQVLLQAGLSVLAQANFQSQGFISLLG